MQPALERLCGQADLDRLVRLVADLLAWQALLALHGPRLPIGNRKASPATVRHSRHVGPHRPCPSTHQGQRALGDLLATAYQRLAAALVALASVPSRPSRQSQQQTSSAEHDAAERHPPGCHSPMTKSDRSGRRRPLTHQRTQPPESSRLSEQPRHRCAVYPASWCRAGCVEPGCHRRFCAGWSARTCPRSSCPAQVSAAVNGKSFIHTTQRLAYRPDALVRHVTPLTALVRPRTAEPG